MSDSFFTNVRINIPMGLGQKGEKIGSEVTKLMGLGKKGEKMGSEVTKLQI